MNGGIMKRLQIAASVLAAAAFVAACAERDSVTAPSADAAALSPASFLGDRPYTWSFTCQGGWSISAAWDWTENGTVIASGSAFCVGDQRFTATAVRPATANGFRDRKSTRLNSSHGYISYAVFCLKKKKKQRTKPHRARSDICSHRLH